MTPNPNHRFDRLLHAMLKRTPLGAGKTATKGPTSSEGSDEDSGGTQTPKGTSGATSSKLKRKSRS